MSLFGVYILFASSFFYRHFTENKIRPTYTKLAQIKFSKLWNKPKMIPLALVWYSERDIEFILGFCVVPVTQTGSLVGCLVWFEPSANSPLDKDAGLHGVHNAPEARLLLRAPQYQTHLTREGGRQPITHLRRHRVRLDVTELILGVHQPPERERERERVILKTQPESWRGGLEDTARAWENSKECNNAFLCIHFFAFFPPAKQCGVSAAKSLK